MGNKKYFWGAIIVVVIIITASLGSSNVTDQPVSGNPTIDVNPNVKVEATEVNVAQFYDGQDGYSISIPSGNRSTCVWNWEGGNAAIPDSTTTYANTATEKHTLVYYSGDTFNYSVNCFDDFGNQYVGVFPTDNQTSETPIAPKAVVNNTAQQAQPPVQKPVVNTFTPKVATTQESLQCSQQAKVVFDQHYNNTTQNGRYPINGSWNYTNHFNANLGKCFMVETLYADFGLGYNLSQGLYDVYENKQIGFYSDPGGETGCSTNGVYGCTEEQFSVFLNSMMETGTY